MSGALDRLIHELAKLPGVGEKTAMRYAFFILREKPQYAQALMQAIGDVKSRIRLCSQCFHLTEADPCAICVDARREPRALCVVEETSDLLAIERTRAWRGLYHVLHGVLSPLDGVGPENLKIAELLRRLEGGAIEEVVVATNANVEGEATALYLTKLLKPAGIRMTRLATGIPVGGDLEYIDATTLARAFEERHAL